MKPRRLFSIVALAVASLGIVVEAPGGVLPTTLDQAVANSPFTFGGDKSVSFLSVIPSGTQPPILSAISVSDATVATGVPSFSFSGPIVSATGTGNTSDLAATFTVTSAGLPITAVSLVANGSIPGGTFANIGETIHEGNTILGAVIGSLTLVGTGSLAIPLLNPATGQTAFSTITIQKNILAFGGPNALNANYSQITQDFRQVVPEPSTAGVAVFGAAAVIAYGWSRHRREQRRQAAA